MRDPTDLEGQERAEAEIRTKDQIRRNQELEDIKWLMAHAPGRRIAARLLAKTGVSRTPFNTNGSTMAFNAGMQNVGLWFQAELLNASPDAFLKLLKEFSSE